MLMVILLLLLMLQLLLLDSAAMLGCQSGHQKLPEVMCIQEDRHLWNYLEHTRSPDWYLWHHLPATHCPGRGESDMCKQFKDRHEQTVGVGLGCYGG